MAGFFLALTAVAVALEAGGRLGLRLLHRFTGVFYAPRDAPRLSAACRDFLTRLVAAGGQGGRLWFDPVLGWAPAPDRKDERGARETNSRGIRARTEPRPVPGPQSTRIAIFGDCLTFGEGLPLEDTWGAQLEHLVPDAEVLNFGVDGYGLDQCYLRYTRSLADYGGNRFVVIAFVSSNIYKSVNAFRPFYAYDHDLKLAKPRFRLRDSSLEPVPNPVAAVAGYEALLRDPAHELRRIGEFDDYFARQYRRRAADVFSTVRLARVVRHEALELRRVRDRRGRFVAGSVALNTTLAVLDAFCARVRAEASEPVVLLLPTPEDLRTFHRHGRRPWPGMAAHLTERQVRSLDALDTLAGLDPRREPAFDGRHFTATACRRLAAAIAPLFTAPVAATTAVKAKAPEPPAPRARPDRGGTRPTVPGASGTSNAPMG